MGTVLEIKGLVKRFGGLMAVDNIDFELKEGEIKGLIGPNGSGKTTFYNLVTGVYKPDSGKVVFMGEDITRLPPNKICRKGLARTYQVSSIFPSLSVYENVRLAAQLGFGGGASPFRDAMSIKEVVDRVSEMLEIVGIQEQSGKLASELSQADQRLLEVAIALGSNPKLLLLDEPTAGLSAKETAYLVETLRKLFLDEVIKNIVLVEHDIEVVTGLAHTICVLNYGQVIKDGTIDEVCNDPKVQEVYLRGG